MKKILILMGRYLPGYKDGGPVRTIANLVELFGDDYDFRIVALDRDHGDSQSYSSIKLNEWNQVGKAKVWYISPSGYTFSLIRRLTKESDIVYLCGFYDDYGYKSLFLNKAGLLWNKPLVVASMGTFSEGALLQKANKKKAYITLLKYLGFFKNMTWSVTSLLEESDLKKEIGIESRCIIAEDLPRINIINKITDSSPKGEIKLVYLSRICKHKNLIQAIEILNNVQSKVEFSIYGPIQEKEYWEMCKKKLEFLPKNITWEYLGSIPTENVQMELSRYDAFLLPTRGENYGHSIFEALSSGCIPIISDKTPWSDIAVKNVGYIFPLEDSSAFVGCVEFLSHLNKLEKKEIQNRAQEYAAEKVLLSREKSNYRLIFDITK